MAQIRHDPDLRNEARELRSIGKTYTEINQILEINIPKSTLSYWCRNVTLPKSYEKKLALLFKVNAKKGREKALIVHRKKRRAYLDSLKESNQKIAGEIRNKNTAKIALAALCLGEASKYSRGSQVFTLGSSDKRIVIIFIKLLEFCFEDFDLNKIRCTVQCRADQNTRDLEEYWQKTTRISNNLFYKSRIDPRTIGKKTKDREYKGVLRVDYLSTNTQLDLEALADLLVNNISNF